MEYVYYILTLACLTAGVVASLNLTMGYGGLPMLGHFAFPLVGAYAVGIFSVKLGFAPILGVVLAPVAGMLVASVFVIPGVNLREEYAALGAVALGLLVPDILNNWISLTNGPYGIGGILDASGGHGTNSVGMIASLAGLYLLSTVWLQTRVRRCQFGRLLIGSRDNEKLLPSLGVSAGAIRSTAILLSGSWAALGGGIYAIAITYVAPSSYTFSDSLMFIVMLLLGGRGTLWGPLLGAIVVLMCFELLRLSGVPGGPSAQIQAILLGIVLLLLVVYRPHGLLGRPLLK